MLKPSYEKVGCLEIVESVSHTAQQQSVPESKFCKEVGGDTRHSSSITCQSCLLGLGRFWKVPIANNITCDFEASAFGYFALMMWFFFPDFQFALVNLGTIWLLRAFIKGFPGIFLQVWFTSSYIHGGGWGPRRRVSTTMLLRGICSKKRSWRTTKLPGKETNGNLFIKITHMFSMVGALDNPSCKITHHTST